MSSIRDIDSPNLIDTANSPLPNVHAVDPWRWALLAILLYVLAVVVIYWPTMQSMVDIWSRSDTFAHGFIIAPVSLWLIWQQREGLAIMTPRVQPWFMVPMVAMGILWLMSELVDVLVIQQLTFVLLLIFGVCALLGTAIARRLLFPLAFLLFMVPMGENLIAPMMDFTAASTVWMVRQTGIPVYQEGLYFSLPTGNWSVVEACSGIRYLIASITLGCMYAYLMYSSLSKRLIFVAASIVVPVIANTLRAFMIVMIGHSSDMTLAVGVDHLIYGWFFFGIVIFIMFLVGSFFRDARPEQKSAQATSLDGGSDLDLSLGSGSTFRSGLSAESRLFWSNNNSSVYVACVLIAVTSLVWPSVPKFLPEGKAVPADAALIFPAALNDWRAVQDPGWSWRPLTAGADITYKGFYASNGVWVGLYVNQYLSQTQGGELVSGLDQWIIPEVRDQQWHLLAQGSARMRVVDRLITVDQARVKSPEAELLLWRWYRIGEHDTANPYLAKLLEALSKLTFQSTSAVRIYAVTPVRDSVDASVESLQSFMEPLFPELVEILSPAGELH